MVCRDAGDGAVLLFKTIFAKISIKPSSIGKSETIIGFYKWPSLSRLQSINVIAWEITNMRLDCAIVH